MQPATSVPGWPIWYTWPNTTDAFAARGGVRDGELGGTGSSLLVREAAHQGRLAVAAIPVNVTVSIPPVFYPIPQQVLNDYPNATSRCIGHQATIS